jgi:hypothetical protein
MTECGIIKKQKEQVQQLKEQQQKQLLDEKIAKEAKDQRNIEKAQRKAAKKKAKQEAEEKVKQEKANKKIEKKRTQLETQIEFQKQLEEKAKKQSEQAQREKVEKERAQESLIINKNVIEAQERVNNIEKEIIEISGGEVDQNNVDRLQLLQEKLTREQDTLQNCILKAKVNHFESEQRLIAARKKLADQRKQDQRDWALNMGKELVIAITKASVKTVRIMAQFAKDGFMALKDCSRLSEEDQEAIIRGLF